MKSRLTGGCSRLTGVYSRLTGANSWLTGVYSTVSGENIEVLLVSVILFRFARFGRIGYFGGFVSVVSFRCFGFSTCQKSVASYPHHYTPCRLVTQYSTQKRNRELDGGLHRRLLCTCSL